MMHLRLPALVSALLVAVSGTLVGQPLAAAETTVPTLVLTSPSDNAVLWEGDLTLAAEAAPAETGAEIARVDFYVDPGHPNGRPVPFRSDATYPYEVRVPVADLGWEILTVHKVTAVAVDTAGQSSSHPSSAGAAGTSWVTLGPPPLVTWSPSPPAPDVVAGSTSRGLRVDFSAALDDRVPEGGTWSSSPRLFSVDHLLDGRVVRTSRLDDAPRTMTGSAFFSSAGAGLTGGVHRVGVRVTAAYHGGFRTATEVSADVLVADGTRLAGPVMAGRRVVEDGFVVTAGDTVRFRVPVAARVPGTYLSRVNVQTTDSRFDRWTVGYVEFPCDGPDTCTASATVRGTNPWFVPDEPGEATLTITSTVHGDPGGSEERRTLLIQPAARLDATVSRNRVRRGETVLVRGRLTRLDNGAPEAGRTVRVQWRRVGAQRWSTVSTRTTNRYGRIRARMAPARSGDYRLVSPAVTGELGKGLSRPRWVAVRR